MAFQPKPFLYTVVPQRLHLELVEPQWPSLDAVESNELDAGGSMAVAPDSEGTDITLPRGPHNLTRKEVGDDQKRRLVQAMLDEIAENGYADSPVAPLIVRAQVSRKTFYVHFNSREDLLLAAFDSAFAWILDQTAKASKRGGGSTRRLEAALRKLARCTTQNPGATSICAIDIAAAHASGFALRQEANRQTGQLLEECLTTEHQLAALPQLLSEAIAGSIYRTLDAGRRAGGQDTLTTEALELARWVRGYHPAPPEISEAPTYLRRATPWIARSPYGGRAPGTLTVAPTDYAPPSRKPSRGQLAHIYRERILDAVARLVAEHGYTQLTAQSIATAADLPERAFLAQFANKDEAFLAACELGHIKAQAIVARAREGAPTWRTGVQGAIVGLYDFFSSEPLFTNLALIAAPLAGPRMVDRHNQHVAAYARLLFHDAPQRRRPPEIAAIATTQALLEIAYVHAGKDRLAQLPNTLMQATYLALAPYLGTTEAAKHAIG